MKPMRSFLNWIFVFLFIGRVIADQGSDPWRPSYPDRANPTQRPSLLGSLLSPLSWLSPNSHATNVEEEEEEDIRIPYIIPKLATREPVMNPWPVFPSNNAGA
jgi:hypothetical protein